MRIEGRWGVAVLLLLWVGCTETHAEAPRVRVDPFEGLTHDDLARAVYPKWDPAAGTTGETFRWGDEEQGQRIARFSQARAWRGQGREQLLVAFEVWFDDWSNWAQAVGGVPCDVALLEREGERLVLKARGEVPAGCEGGFDLAPYRLDAQTMLLGVRERWMNHGFETIRLTLLKVEPPRLRVVFQEDIGETDPDGNEIRGTLSMLPSPSGKASIRLQQRSLDDGGKRVRRDTLFVWVGGKYEKTKGRE